MKRMGRVVVGMDEVGRGCWAGPVVAGAVILKHAIPGVKDSKLLTRLQREVLDTIIRQRALAVGIGWADVDEINSAGLTGALKLAFSRALAEIRVEYEQILLDGTYNFLPGARNVRTLVNADATEPAVSAASIVAKVARDNFMIAAAGQYPGYGFERHVGYGTALHRDALATLGVCKLHRLAFKPIQLMIEPRA